MSIIALIFVALSASGNNVKTAPERCSSKNLEVRDLKGTWAGLHYRSDRYFSIRLNKTGQGSLVFVAGPHHAPTKALLKLNSVKVKGSAFTIIATDKFSKITIEGCVWVEDDSGAMESATLTLSNVDGTFPHSFTVPFERGEYMARRKLFESISSAISDDWKPTPRKPDPTEGQSEVDFSKPLKLEPKSTRK